MGKRLKDIGKGQADKNQFIGMIQKFINKELSMIDDKKEKIQVSNLVEEVKKKMLLHNALIVKMEK